MNLSKYIIETKAKLSNKIKELTPLIKQTNSLIDEMKKEIDKIKKITDILNSTKNFKVKVKVPKIIKEDLKPGFYTITCLKCNYSCLENYRLSNSSQIKNSPTMDNNGYCRYCPQKCFWDTHKNVPFTIKLLEVEEERILDDLKKRYYDNKKELDIRMEIVRRKELDIKYKKEKCYEIDNEIKDLINKLKNVSFCPNDYKSLYENITIP